MHAWVEAPERLPSHLRDGSIATAENPSRIIPKDHMHISFHLENEPDEVVKTVIKGVNRFATQVSVEVGNRMLSWMKEESQKPYGLHPRLHHKVKTEGLYTPSFDFFDAETARSFFDSVDLYAETIHPHGVLMVYNLPQPLAHYWWLVGGFTDEKEPTVKKIIGKHAIEYDTAHIQELMNTGDFSPIPAWGDAYFRMRKVFWDQIKKGHPEKGLDFERINQPGDHDASWYYYMFEVRAVEDLLREEDQGKDITIFTYQPNKKISA